MSSILIFIKKALPMVVTWSLVCVAIISIYVLYSRWTAQPWTRDAQVRADIIQITPQVNGNIIEVAVKDNQLVRQGDLLFIIDPSTYQLDVEQASVALEQAREEVASLEAKVRVSEAQYKEALANTKSAKRNISAAEQNVKNEQANIELARAGINSAEQLIKQRQAELKNARSEAARAKRLVKKKAGSIEDAESTAAQAIAKEAELGSAQAGLKQSQSKLTQAEVGLKNAEINLLLANDAYVEAQAAEASALAGVDESKASLGLPGEQNVRVRTSKVSLEQSKLSLSYTRVTAPCDSYVSNLSIDKGTYAIAGQPLLVLVSKNSFRVHAYFQETKLRNIQQGDEAMVTLMSHPDQKLTGIVENAGFAVNPPDISPTEGQPGQVPQIQPTFDWVRLPQRVPVRIKLKNIPENIQLISGTTASVSVLPARKK